MVYYPNEFTVHAAATVDFNSVVSGEPHTVTFGTLVDQGLAKAKPTDTDEPAELKKIPPLRPDGPGDAIQASAQPCFLRPATAGSRRLHRRSADPARLRRHAGLPQQWNPRRP